MSIIKKNSSKFFKINLFLIVVVFFLFSKVYLNAAENRAILSVGNQDAKVTIKVFSSLTCPHCANFHTKVIPEIKREYVDTGKVQIIFIDFPLDQAAFNASKILHCADKEKQIN